MTTTTNFSDDDTLFDDLILDDVLAGKHALVTGSTSGLGRAIAAVLAASGARVVVHGRDAERAERVRAGIERIGGHATVVLGDLRTADDTRAFADRVLDALDGRVDILVNNAGIFPAGPTADLDDATVDALLAANIRVPHHLVGAFAPAMAERGEGAIVNVSSWMSRVGTAGVSLYPATKAALEQLTRGWAREFGADGVRVNAVAPGAMATPGNLDNADFIEHLTAGTPAARPGRPVDVAWAVRYLVSPHAAYVHGTVLDVDGGMVATR